MVLRLYHRAYTNHQTEAVLFQRQQNICFIQSAGVS